MKPLAESLHVTLVTDPRPSGFDGIIEAALTAGCGCVQLRDKQAPARELLGTAHRLRSMTRAHNALLIVNDRFDVALAAGADGVHVGPHDVPVAAIRRAVPKDFLIGASCDDPALAQRLEADGADYLGCGTVFPTTTKPDAGDTIGVEGVRAVARSVGVPVVAIGGITVANADQLSGSGAVGVAVVSAVMDAPDPAAAIELLIKGLRI